MRDWGIHEVKCLNEPKMPKKVLMAKIHKKTSHIYVLMCTDHTFHPCRVYFCDFDGLFFIQHQLEVCPSWEGPLLCGSTWGLFHFFSLLKGLFCWLVLTEGKGLRTVHVIHCTDYEVKLSIRFLGDMKNAKSFISTHEIIKAFLADCLSVGCRFLCHL